jgi:hypothetical protein
LNLYDTKDKGCVKKGNYRGFFWHIWSYGSHPCAYVGVPPNHPYYNEDEHDINVVCHGGFTYGSYTRKTDPWPDYDLKWFGWDYSHNADYFEGIPEHDGKKKWTVEEIEAEVMMVIEQFGEPYD